MNGDTITKGQNTINRDRVKAGRGPGRGRGFLG